EKRIAINEEVLSDEVLRDLGVSRDELEEAKAAEVGNIFTLKDKYSAPLGLTFADESGRSQNVMMGCYGIGPCRLVGVIAELLGDDRGLVWHTNIAPFHVYLASIGDVGEQAEKLYEELQEAGIEVLYDDRDERPGEKFA